LFLQTQTKGSPVVSPGSAVTISGSSTNKVKYQTARSVIPLWPAMVVRLSRTALPGSLFYKIVKQRDTEMQGMEMKKEFMLVKFNAQEL
jgi:hypothetical protein